MMFFYNFAHFTVTDRWELSQSRFSPSRGRLTLVTLCDKAKFQLFYHLPTVTELPKCQKSVTELKIHQKTGILAIWGRIRLSLSVFLSQIEDITSFHFFCMDKILYRYTPWSQMFFGILAIWGRKRLSQ